MWESTAQTCYIGQRARVNHIPIFHLKMERCYSKTSGFFHSGPCDCKCPMSTSITELTDVHSSSLCKSVCACVALRFRDFLARDNERKHEK